MKLCRSWFGRILQESLDLHFDEWKGSGGPLGMLTNVSHTSSFFTGIIRSRTWRLTKPKTKLPRRDNRILSRLINLRLKERAIKENAKREADELKKYIEAEKERIEKSTDVPCTSVGESFQ